MNLTEARVLREAHNAYVKRISRMTRAQLRDAERADLADRGIVREYGGPVTRDELISALCELHYPAAKLNEAIHVIGHDTRDWPACNFCHDDDGLHAGHLCECDRWAETACTVCGRRAAFHFSTTHMRAERPILTDHGMQGHLYQGRLMRFRLDGCTCANEAVSHKPPCPWAMQSVRPLLHLTRHDLATLASSGDDAAMREWQLRESGGQSELVWCELVNAPAHEGRHQALPNCRHPHNAGHDS